MASSFIALCRSAEVYGSPKIYTNYKRVTWGGSTWTIMLDL